MREVISAAVIHMDRTRDQPFMEGPNTSVIHEVAPGQFVECTAEQHEVYEWNNGRGLTLLFDVTAIRQALITGTKTAELIENPIDPSLVTKLIKHNGVEMWRVEQLEPVDLAIPAIGFGARNPNGEFGLISIDGNHRVARRAIDGCPYAQIYLIELSDFAEFICRPGEELKFFMR